MNDTFAALINFDSNFYKIKIIILYYPTQDTMVQNHLLQLTLKGLTPFVVYVERGSELTWVEAAPRQPHTWPRNVCRLTASPGSSPVVQTAVQLQCRK